MGLFICFARSMEVTSKDTYCRRGRRFNNSVRSASAHAGHSKETRRASTCVSCGGGDQLSSFVIKSGAVVVVASKKTTHSTLAMYSGEAEQKKKLRYLAEYERIGQNKLPQHKASQRRHGYGQNTISTQAHNLSQHISCRKASNREKPRPAMCCSAAN